MTTAIRRKRGRDGRDPTPVAAVGSVHAAAEGDAARARRQRARRRRRAGAAERARRVRAPRRGGEHLGRAERARSPRRRRTTWARSSIPATTRRTGIRSSTRCRAAFAVFDRVVRAVASCDDRAAAYRLFESLLRLGDDRLVLGHRLSEWCGHGPILEEDIALANIALDLIGQATLLLKLAGEIEGKGRDEDALAYFREAVEYPQRAARRAAEGRLRVHDRAAVLLQRLRVLQMDALAKSVERRARRRSRPRR